MNLLKQWMAAASTPEQERLAEMSGTSRTYLYRLASEGQDYSRNAGADLAGRLEAATQVMHKESRGRLPKILRTDLNEACRNCAYARQCLGAAAARGDFDVIEEAGDVKTN